MNNINYIVFPYNNDKWAVRLFGSDKIVYIDSSKEGAIDWANQPEKQFIIKEYKNV